MEARSGRTFCIYVAPRTNTTVPAVSPSPLPCSVTPVIQSSDAIASELWMTGVTLQGNGDGETAGTVVFVRGATYMQKVRPLRASTCELQPLHGHLFDSHHLMHGSSSRSCMKRGTRRWLCR